MLSAILAGLFVRFFLTQPIMPVKKRTERLLR